MSDSARTPTEEPRGGRAAWWMLVVLVTLYMLSMLDRHIIVMLVEPIKADLRLTDFEVSLVLGPAFGLCYAVFGLPLGWAADRLPRRQVIFWGVVVWSLATMLSGLAGGLLVLFASRMLVAIGEASLTPAAHSLMSDSFPKQRLSTAMAVYSTGPKGGTSVAFIVGGLLIAAASAAGTQTLPGFGALEPWRFVMLAVGAPGIVLALLAFSFREPPRRSRTTSDFGAAAAEEGILVFLRRRWQLFVPFFAGFCLVSIASVGMQTWVPSYMARQFGWTPAQYGPALGVINGLGAFTLVLKGLVVDWLYARGVRDAPLRFYFWLLVIFTPLAGLAYMISDPILFLVAYGLVAVVAVPYVLYAAATIQMVSPVAFRGRMSAVLLFVATIASTGFGPTAIAFLTDYVFRDPGKLGVAIAAVSVVCMTGAILCLGHAMRVLRPILLQDDPTAMATPASSAAPPASTPSSSVAG
jgi:Arabinose efflux permease